MLILVCLEADLKHPIAQCVTIERLYGQHSLLIVGHGDKTKAFAFVALQIAYNLQHVAKIKSKKANFNLVHSLTLTDCTAPKGPKSCHNTFSSVSGAKLYTKMHQPELVMVFPCIMLLVIRSLVSGE